MEHASRQFQPDKITAYFRLEWVNLLLITLSGLLYNLGLLAGPWFEGKLAQCLADILDGNKTAACAVLHHRHPAGAGRTIYQTFLCAAVCQQHQPTDEGCTLFQPGAAKEGRSGM